MADYLSRQFDGAAALLPYEIRTLALRLPAARKQETEEFRLRVGRPALCSANGAERLLIDETAPLPVRASDIAQVLEVATRSSVHSALESLRSGFVTVPGGHRVGVCGTAAIREGEVHMIRSISSLSIRIAKEHRGAADCVLSQLYEEGQFQSTILLSKPGIGKTTLLRDLIRQLSDSGLRVAVADERGEIAALSGQMPQFDVGAHTDVLEGAPKALAMLMLLRTMSPMVLAADEITASEDVSAIETAANCGVTLLATVHAESLADMQSRPALHGILERGIFRRAVVLSRTDGGRDCAVLRLDGRSE